MLNGVEVDTFTQSFLDLASDPESREEIHQCLRGFFHDARNRLSLLKIGLYVARRSGSEMQANLWSELDLSYQSLEDFVDRVQTLCRPPDIEPYAANLGVWLGERRTLWTQWFEAQGRRLDWHAPLTNAGGWFDPVSLIQGLDVLLFCRAKVGAPGQSASITWSTDPTAFHLEFVEESAALSLPFEGRESRSLSMALPLLARMMSAHQGTLSIENENGLRIRLDWPIRTVPESLA